MNDREIPAPALQRILDRQDIYDVLCRYARGVDRGDWELVRSTYHPDAHDDHVEYQGNIDGLIEWLDARFAGVDNSMHFLGNSLVEQTAADYASAETYFVSSRLIPPTGDAAVRTSPGDALCRQAWGRYLDRFERRDGAWRIANRRVVVDARFTSVAINGIRTDGTYWGLRNAGDPLYAEHATLPGRA
ncbi:nuclear transport factor 2 family protein [Rhodococcus sp. NPDC127530]|uniref:nuclear transport factor 2 family protein n=1 Tax=unclassified Rhodococcus (in: high G+C Gram-positive bacteria) TaxID=192944 RepID=UPI0036456B9B